MIAGCGSGPAWSSDVQRNSCIPRTRGAASSSEKVARLAGLRISADRSLSSGSDASRLSPGSAIIRLPAGNRASLAQTGRFAFNARGVTVDRPQKVRTHRVPIRSDGVLVRLEGARGDVIRGERSSDIQRARQSAEDGRVGETQHAVVDGSHGKPRWFNSDQDDLIIDQRSSRVKPTGKKGLSRLFKATASNPRPQDSVTRCAEFF